ncbi:hypothetical protein [Pontibacter oryzae]|uniref:Uncharacterized protein n=1 Tax=Pontibacter oryzae TaxID=2304593 RepID=A0A399SJ18_9BACT|nr:hypothetical protein [Pontibacter oryzae]RIJ41877.1 hypothetical protein D1627_07665 [Pontibacter oryzae]
MENNNWNYGERPNSPRHRNNPNYDEVNPDSYRGAYRFDNESDHHNVSTWDNSRNTGNNSQYNQRQDYNQNYNRDYNRNYNRDYNSSGYDHDNYNLDSRYRNNDNSYRSSNSSDWGRHHDQRQQQRRSDYQSQHHQPQQHRSVHDRIEDQDPYGVGNFQANYGPDSYGQGGGENYGNEAGSLSYGYDGSNNYDPDWNRHYDPQTGHRRSYHGNYTSRHPEPSQNRDDRENNYPQGNQDRY